MRTIISPADYQDAPPDNHIVISRGNAAKISRDLRKAAEAARLAYEFCSGSYSAQAHSALFAVIAVWEHASGADVMAEVI